MINRFSHATVTAASAALMLLATGAVYPAQASTGPATGRAAPAWPGCAVDKAARGTLYVANSYPMPVGTVTPIQVCTNVAGKPIPVGNAPVRIAITPDGRTAYVVNQDSNNVTPISTRTDKPGKAIQVARRPSAIAITPNGKTAYVANVGFGLASSVIPISTATNRTGKPIRVGDIPEAIVITKDGKTAYVLNFAAASGAPEGSVTPISTATNTAAREIIVGLNPDAIAITPQAR